MVVIDEGRFLLNFRTAEQQLNERNEALIQQRYLPDLLCES